MLKKKKKAKWEPGSKKSEWQVREKQQGGLITQSPGLRGRESLRGKVSLSTQTDPGTQVVSPSITAVHGTQRHMSQEVMGVANMG